MNPLFWMLSAIALAAGLGAIALATSSAKLSGITVAIIFGFLGVFIFWWLLVCFLFVDVKIEPWYRAHCVQGTESFCDFAVWYLAYSHVVYYPLAVALTYLSGRRLLLLRINIKSVKSPDA